MIARGRQRRRRAAGALGVALAWACAGAAACSSLACTTELDAGHNREPRAQDGLQPEGLARVGRLAPDGAGLTLNGAAAAAGDRIVLTTAQTSMSGSAFLPVALSLEPGRRLSASFTGRIDPEGAPLAADGMAFVLHAAPEGARALGRSGGGIGYQGLEPCLAIELDTMAEVPDDVQREHVALVPCATPHRPVAHAEELPVGLATGSPFSVWIEYSTVTHLLSLWLSSTTQRPPMATLTVTADLPATLGASVWVGVSAATGMQVSRHELLALEIWN